MVNEAGFEDELFSCEFCGEEIRSGCRVWEDKSGKEHEAHWDCYWDNEKKKGLQEKME